MNGLHFGSNLAGIWIQINLEIQIQIVDHLLLEIFALAEVCALWAPSNLLFIIIIIIILAI